jgi:hypothetical protein
MRLPRTILISLVLALILGVPAAHASHAQTLTFEAPRDLLDASTRDGALDQIASLGAHSLRVVLYWRNVAPAPDSRTRPTFDATDPGAYTWGQYAPLLDAAKQRGWPVLLTVSGPVPRWATNGAVDNVTRPSPNEFRKFVTAVGRRFGDRVASWSIWNEPNHPQFLLPQYDKRHRPVSPKTYRGLFRAAQRGLRNAGLAGAPLLMGETAPRGTGKDVAPLTFLRGVLCLNSRYHRTGKCSKLAVDGYAHHAYTTQKGPFFVPSGRNDVTIGVLGRLTKALDRAAAAGAIPKHLPIYLTEFGIQSTPDPLFGVSLIRQAEYRAISERIAYDNPRVRAFSQYLLRDDLPIQGVPKAARYGGFESGLRTSNGKVKPAFDGFRLPVVARRTKRGVSLWGLVRPATGVTKVRVEVSDRGKAFHKLATVRTDARGYWTTQGRDRSGRRWRVRWTAADGTVFTAPPGRAGPAGG